MCPPDPAIGQAGEAVEAVEARVGGLVVGRPPAQRLAVEDAELQVVDRPAQAVVVDDVLIEVKARRQRRRGGVGS